MSVSGGAVQEQEKEMILSLKNIKDVSKNAGRHDTLSPCPPSCPPPLSLSLSLCTLRNDPENANPPTLFKTLIQCNGIKR
jgi:hypothetical protein